MMSEEEIKEALGVAGEEILDDNKPVEEEVVEDITQDLSPAEKRAHADGWRPEDEFEGNPDNWKTAGEYNLYGEMQAQLRDVEAKSRRKEAEFEERLVNVNKLNKAQQETRLAELRAEQRGAVDNADTEQYDRIQEKIDAHEPVVDAVSDTAKNPAILAWEAKNPWVNDVADPKAKEALNFYDAAASIPGSTIVGCLAYVDEKLAKLYPAEVSINTRREAPTMAEQSRKTTSKRNGRNAELTMNDLTADERDEWREFGSTVFGNEKDYLKAVADIRKEV